MTFSDLSAVPVAFQHLYDRGARNMTVNGGYVWVKESQSEKPFSGPDDAVLVASAAVEAFHVVLGGIAGTDCPIPDLGMFAFTDRLALDYRMGSGWGPREIQSLLELLRQLRGLGGKVSVPWWGSDGERDFLSALSGA
ncbi:hypothetical protein RZV17_12185 [Xanthomonas cannabis]|uniref:hypothetical protein n=1 Tax=Xanthomonas cannabis TaxID=1885674 RepID=UPI0033B392B5